MTLALLIRELDPACNNLTDAQQRRADALLERVVREPDLAVNRQPIRRSRRRLLRVGAMVSAGAAAAAIAVGVI